MEKILVKCDELNFLAIASVTEQILFIPRGPVAPVLHRNKNTFYTIIKKKIYYFDGYNLYETIYIHPIVLSLINEEYNHLRKLGII